MPQDRPSLSKLIFISYEDQITADISSNDELRSGFFATWIYQRLKYAGFPVRTYKADEAIGGAGFGPNSIDVASPMISIVSDESKRLSDIELALNEGKEVIVALIGRKNVPGILDPDILGQCLVIDFSPSANHNTAFQELTLLLHKREYPVGRPIAHPDGDGHLAKARDHYQKFTANKSEFRSDFYFHYHYMNVFSDIYNKNAKIQALRDFGQYRIMPGLVAAALQDDPQEEVQAIAALILARFSNWNFASYLYAVANQGYSSLAAVYAKIGHAIHHDSSLAMKIVNDITFVYSDMKTTSAEAYNDRESAKNASNVSSEFDVFISYAREDAEQHALNLARELGNKSFDVWIDTKLSPGTQVWTNEIENAIRKSSVFIVLVSPKIHDSKWVKREISFAESIGKTIIPITAIKTEKPIDLATAQGLRGDPVLSNDIDSIVEELIKLLEGPA